MERVARNRGLPIVECMASHPSIPINTWVLIRGSRSGRVVRARVTDTSAPKDRSRHIRLRRIELDYECSSIVCGRRWRGAARECPVEYIVQEERDQFHELSIPDTSRSRGEKGTTSLVGPSQREDLSLPLCDGLFLERDPKKLSRSRFGDRSDGEYGEESRDRSFRGRPN